MPGSPEPSGGHQHFPFPQRAAQAAAVCLLVVFPPPTREGLTHCRLVLKSLHSWGWPGALILLPPPSRCRDYRCAPSRLACSFSLVCYSSAPQVGTQRFTLSCSSVPQVLSNAATKHWNRKFQKQKALKLLLFLFLLAYPLPDSQ